MAYSASDFVADLTAHAVNWGVLADAETEAEDLEERAERLKDAISSMLAQRSLLLLLMNQAVERVKLANKDGQAILSAWVIEAEQYARKVAQACGSPAGPLVAPRFPDRLTFDEACAAARRASLQPDFAGRAFYVDGRLYMGSEGRAEVGAVSWCVAQRQSTSVSVRRFVDGKAEDL